MSPQLLGALVGAAVGFSGFLVLRSVAARTEKERGEEGRKIASLLRAVAIADLVIMTLLGAYVGPMVLGA